jgi:hypothetical protein
MRRTQAVIVSALADLLFPYFIDSIEVESTSRLEGGLQG